MDEQVEQLHSQADALVRKFESEGKANCLDEAITLDREALVLCPPGHPIQPVLLIRLAMRLCTRFKQLGSVEDIEEAIVHDREALVLRSPAHPDLPVSLNCLAHHLYTRYKRLGSVEDLKEAIVHDRDALALCPPGHPGRSKSLNNLAVHLSDWCTELGSLDDLNEAIVLDRDGLALRPQGHPDRSASLYTLSCHYYLRSMHLGSIEDLQEAVTLGQNALALRPPGHPDRPASLNSLGVYLRIRYDQLGSVEDLNEGIVLNQEALVLRPPQHPDRPRFLNNLAVKLYTRYQQLGSAEDLNEAIFCDRDALALYPPGHPIRSMTLGNLSVHLRARYTLLGSVDDINEAIVLGRDVLTVQPPGHSGRQMSLSRLAAHLYARYEQLGLMDDLSEAIVLDRNALALCPLSHMDRPVALSYLASHLCTRYNQLGSVEDLDEAIALDRDTLVLCLPGHPNRSAWLNNLAQHLSIRFTCSSRSEDKEEVFDLYTQLAHAPPTRSSTDLSAARAWIRAAEDFHHPTTLLAYETSLRLLVHHLAALPSLPQHLTVLKHLTSSLAVDAFSASLRNHSLTKAVELLEQGRGVFWTQLARLHSPIDDVVASGPEGKTLGDEFVRQTSLIRKVIDSPSPDQHDRVCNLNIELQKVITKIRKLAGFECFLLPPPFSYLQQAALHGPVVIVNSSEYGCDALVVLFGRDPVHIPLLITREGVQALSSKLATLTARTTSVDMTRGLCVLLRELWDRVVSPIVNFLQTICTSRSRIWWCPTAEFSSLPLHAAGPYRKGQQNLADLYISSYTTTISALIRARQHHVLRLAPKEKRFVAIGQANAIGESQLFSVSAELVHVRDHVNGPAIFTRIEGLDSSIGRVSKALGENEWVHFACHGIPDRKQPFESAFALHDGHFTVERIIRCKLEDPQFAYLSACHTTVGDEESPDEVIHLASAMQFAGFRSVIGTMWAVDDGETNKITSMFYDNIKDEYGRLDYTRAALALNKTMRTLVNVPFDQRVLYIHLGA